MSCHRYVVMNFEGQWTVLYQGTHYGPYATRDSAVQAALQTANALSEFDEATEVAVLESDNQVHMMWTSGPSSVPEVAFH